MLLLGSAESPKNWARGQRSISKIRGIGQSSGMKQEKLVFDNQEKPFQYSCWCVP